MKPQRELFNNEEWVDLEDTMRRPKVLVVEDDITSEPLWQHILMCADQSAFMTWATSVNEADQLIREAWAERRPYDLVISDIFLSGTLTGIDLWERFHSQMPNSIILMSAIDPLKVQKHLRGMGEPIYLQKPLNMHNTIETVYELLRRP